MSLFVNPDSVGLNVCVAAANDERRVIVIQQVADEHGNFSDKPIFWGHDELGSLTEKETVARDEILGALSKSHGTDETPAKAVLTKNRSFPHRLLNRLKGKNI